MNAFEANVLLTKVNFRDRFPRWRTPADLATASEEWAADLAGVSIEDALDAMREHYATETTPLMIADILAHVPERLSSWAGNITEQRLAAEAAGTVKALEPGDV